MNNILEKLVREIGKDFGYCDFELELGTKLRSIENASLDYVDYKKLKEGKAKIKMNISPSIAEEKLPPIIAHEFGHIKSEEVYTYIPKIRKLRRYLAVPYAIGFFALLCRFPHLIIGTTCLDGALLSIQEILAEREARRVGYRRSGLRNYFASLLDHGR